MRERKEDMRRKEERKKDMRRKEKGDVKTNRLKYFYYNTPPPYLRTMPVFTLFQRCCVIFG